MSVAKERKLDLPDIERAAERIRPFIIATPTYNSDTLSKQAKCDCWLKLENLQLTRSFKIRGALNKILSLGREVLSRKGMITASAGNHAQGVAFAARLLQLENHTTIYMPETTPETKQEKTRSYGVRVELYGKSFDEAKRKSEGEANRLGAEYIHAFNDLDIIAGQGTIGLEMLSAVPTLDAIVVPVGGGGLISGIAIAAKKRANRQIRVIGVEPVGAHCAYYARRQGRPLALPTLGQTIADGVRVQCIGDKSFQLIQEYVDELYTVSDESIEQALAFLATNAKLIVEGAAATGVALLLTGHVDPDQWLQAETQNKPAAQRIPELNEHNRVGIVLSGGNVDSSVIIRALSLPGR